MSLNLKCKEHTVVLFFLIHSANLSLIGITEVIINALELVCHVIKFLFLSAGTHSSVSLFLPS